MKLGPVGVELLRVNEQTDMMKLTVAFRNFANAPVEGCAQQESSCYWARYSSVM
jgi:hypothetical protein